MNYLLPFLTGIGASVLGTLLPGILNATVVKISKEEGMKNACHFMLGTFVIIALQTYLAVFFAKIIDRSVFITNILREIGFVVFLILTIYFFTVKPKKQIKAKVNIKRKRFTQGILLALINVFPIFYYVFITVTVLNRNLYEINYISNILLTIGVLLGTFLTFMFYINLFKKTVVEESFVLQNINKIMGCITAAITIFNFCKLFL
ncbi:Threonine/homoserine/homoserine lactone efflux protein [Paenimyroides aquimaris]|uniref:Threonine/homoserine/homoserine lactone efflux protein n=1 Tax=Paenimyroides marinum TaxID=1159016 RepID=A0A1H6MH61_9FLAO|nr:LysE family transporter [Paenimyroides aquimaris]SEH96957.1 Threonine/homoserine/homoserine lactone efflux protein [Paenimyroides aquimaris]